jgi:hypothetical protein
LRRAKRVLAAVLISALILGVMSTPAFAINDVLVPADNCAPDNAQAVGHPAAPHLRATGQVFPPVSENNPGVSEGAQADVQPPC